MSEEKQHPPDGKRWVVNASYGSDALVPVPDKPGWVQFDPAVQAESYGVVDAFNWNIQCGKFKSEARARAQAKANELNRLDVQGPLDPAFAARRKRLKKLAPYYNSGAHSGPHEARWPVQPDRYLVMDGGVGWHAESCEYLVSDRAGLEENLKEDESNIYRIVDLDTGKDIPFERTVSAVVMLPE
jgi:hypothetical protein